MRKILEIVLISSLCTVLFLGFEHFCPLPNVGDKSGDCCDQFVYTNRHGFPLIFREDVSGGLAGLPPRTQYHIDNYIKVGLVIFVGATITQLAVVFYKRRSIS